MAKTKDMSPENRVNIVTEKLIAASRKAIQSATPVEALAVWKFIKTQQLSQDTWIFDNDFSSSLR